MRRKQKRRGLQVGQTLEFDYPTRNRFNVPLEFVRERITIIAIRDMATNPLTVDELDARPLVRRGSLLIVGFNHATGDSRQFYLEAMRGLERDGKSAPIGVLLPSFRLALYQPGDADDLDFVGPEFEPRPFDALAMQAAMRKFEDWRETLPDLPYTLGAFPMSSKCPGTIDELIDNVIVGQWQQPELPQCEFVEYEVDV